VAKVQVAEEEDEVVGGVGGGGGCRSGSLVIWSCSILKSSIYDTEIQLHYETDAIFLGLRAIFAF
jgi:hypothetical protein